MDHLAGPQPALAEALAAPGVVRCAVNQEYADPATPLRRATRSPSSRP